MAKNKSAPSPAAQSMTKTAFILSLPRDLPAGEAAQRAIEAGFPTKREHVHEIRSAAKRKAQAVRAPRTTPGATTSKTAFVLSQPPEIPAAEVVRRAGAAGLTMKPEYVRKIRSAAKVAVQKAPASKPRVPAPPATRRKPGRPPRNLAPAEAQPSAETAFRKAVLDLGLQRAKDLLAALEEGLRRLVAGG
jgi:hypothetical protein